jgi:hypothetical protein
MKLGKALVLGLIAYGMVGMSTASALNLYFENLNTNYNPEDVYITWISGPTPFDVTLNGQAVTMYQGAAYTYTDPDEPQNNFSYDTSALYISQSYKLSDLGSGFVINAPTISATIQVTLGAPLNTGIGQVSQPGVYATGVLNYGSPSYTAGTADPNWNVRWAPLELTVDGTPAAYGDITAINAFNVPFKIENYASTDASGTALQTMATTSTTNSPVLQRLYALAEANQANALNANGVTHIGSPNWYVTDTNGNFLRMVAPASGPTSAGGSPSVIGPNPSFQSYVNHVETENISTSVSGNAAGSTYAFTVTAEVQGGDTDASIVVTGTTGLNTGDTLKMIIGPDTGVGTAGADYGLSNALYGAAYGSNPVVIYMIGNTVVTQAEFWEAAGGGNATTGQTLIDQTFHDVASGFNFGLIGNDTMVTNSGINSGNPISLNDMGSAGWTVLENQKNAGELSYADLSPLLYNLTGTDGTAYYNEWAAIIAEESLNGSAYGFAYGDFLQPVAIFTDQVPAGVSSNGQTTDVGSWKVTILGDPAAVPEPGTVGLLALGLGAWAFHSLRTRRRHEKA